MRKTLLFAGIFTLLAGPASADLSFVQITQGQTGKGADGVFGKTWVEIKDGKMRLISGYARRVPGDKEETAAAPKQVVQILDLAGNRRLILHPEDKSYAEAALHVVDYGNGLGRDMARDAGAGPGGAEWRIVDTEVKLERKLAERKIMGVSATHHRIYVKLTLEGPENGRATARMEQNVWAAPVGGALAKTLLDLLAFENDYRRAVGGGLTPLDHERYQVREVAGVLRVPEEELRGVVALVREQFREFPGYPVASSVAWWREDESPKGPALGDISPRHRYSRTDSAYANYSPKRPTAAKKRAHRTKLARHRASFRVINWRQSERQINQLYRKAVFQFPGPQRVQEDDAAALVTVPRGRDGETRADEPDIYPKFESELRKVLKLLVEAQDQAQADAPEDGERPGPPFYEIYSELHGLESRVSVPSSAFSAPAGWRKLRGPD